MKLLHNIIYLGLTFLVMSCVKDKTNYSLLDPEIITVEGFDGDYTILSGTDRFNIDPIVKSNDPNANFEYKWWIYEADVPGSFRIVDTIGHERKLDYLVTQPAKGWVLVFSVTNKNTKYTKHFTADVNIITSFTRGWYVAKDDGTQADLDLFLTPENIIPDSKLENVYSLQNGRKLQGKAQLLSFFSNYRSEVTGVLGNTRTLFFVTDKDVSATYINTLKELRGYNTLFYEPPAVKSPSLVALGQSAIYMVNDGHCHSLYTLSANTGQFGVAKIRDDKNSPYQLSKYFYSWRNIDPYFFDQTSSSFVSTTGTGAIMTGINDIGLSNGRPQTEMSANKNNKTMLFMGFKTTAKAYAVFQDKTNQALKILTDITPSKTAFKMDNDTLKVMDKLYNASNYTLLDGDENMLYFATANEIWSRNLSNKVEQRQFALPAGEEVTFIRHRKYTEDVFSYNYVMVGTKVGNNYKIRMFTKASGNLSASPAFTLEGTGVARDVMYVSPVVNEFTYTPTF
ncbi:PKD-like family lipoprotein [Sphingobacterium kyonggiense]